MENGKTFMETITHLMNTPNDGMILAVSEATDLPEDEFCQFAAGYLAARDELEKAARRMDRDISKLCLMYGEKMRIWGVNPTILRRAMLARGLYEYS